MYGAKRGHRRGLVHSSPLGREGQNGRAGKTYNWRKWLQPSKDPAVWEKYRSIVKQFDLGVLSELHVPFQGREEEFTLRQVALDMSVGYTKGGVLHKIGPAAKKCGLEEAVLLSLKENLGIIRTSVLYHYLVSHYPHTIAEIPSDGDDKNSNLAKHLVNTFPDTFALDVSSKGKAEFVKIRNYSAHMLENSENTVQMSATRSSVSAPQDFSVLRINEAVINSSIDRIRRALEECKKNATKSRASNRHANNQRGATDGWLEWAAESITKRMSSEQYAEILTQRKRLPAQLHKSTIVDTILHNHVTIVLGATGCGKTTQIPQFLLDEMIVHQRKDVNIVCTQPRRISAVSVAERVAEERCESVGELVGYQIRFEKQQSDTCKLVYCTTGVLLNQLKSDSILSQYTHIIVDEVHEREMSSDFLILQLRDILKVRPHMHVVLMSATLDPKGFERYFEEFSPATLSIPGKTNFPIEEHYLEDVLALTGYNVSFTGQSNSKGRGEYRFECEEIPATKVSPEELVRVLSCSLAVAQSISQLQMTPDYIDFGLIASTIRYIQRNRPQGAILVFLPGYFEIGSVMKLLSSDKNLWVLPLHSMIPTTEQRLVFKSPPPHKTKVILSTNLAETSVTIEDVLYVIDSGKTRLTTYLTNMHIQALVTQPISKANSQQRRGRAGRCQAGEVYRLYTRSEFDTMFDTLEPEMKRTPVEELCLMVKVHRLGKIKPTLARALDPPSASAVENAVAVLTAIGAFDEDEEITHLGTKLAALPLHPRLGRLILYGHLMGCLDAACIIASFLSYKSPFYVPLGLERDADDAKRELSENCLSDHITLFKTYRKWVKLRKHEQVAFCEKRFISNTNMRFTKRLHEDISSLCENLGLADRGQEQDDLIRAVICVGLWPNISARKKKGNITAYLGGAKRRVEVHRGSVNSILPKNYKHCLENKWLSYYAVQHIKKTILFDTTFLWPITVALCGPPLHRTFEISGHGVFYEVGNTEQSVLVSVECHESLITLRESFLKLCGSLIGERWESDCVRLAFDSIKEVLLEHSGHPKYDTNIYTRKGLPDTRNLKQTTSVVSNRSFVNKAEPGAGVSRESVRGHVCEDPAEATGTQNILKSTDFCFDRKGWNYRYESAGGRYKV
eukprot:CFRG8550T1